jgi:hypothetical protein
VSAEEKKYNFLALLAALVRETFVSPRILISARGFSRAGRVCVKIRRFRAAFGGLIALIMDFAARRKFTLQTTLAPAFV